MRRGALIAILLAATATTARAEDKDDGEPPAFFDLAFDVQRGWYDEAPGTMDQGGRTNTVYALSMHLLAPDGDKATPLRSIPAIWFGLQLGWIGGSTASTSGAQEDGGFLMDFQLAGPWAVVHRPGFRAYVGVGFNFGFEMGHPSGVERSDLAADAFAMGIVDIGSASHGLIVEGEYAAGAGYNEQRGLALLRLGNLGIGASVVAGQSDINYFRLGAHVARTF